MPCFASPAVIFIFSRAGRQGFNPSLLARGLGANADSLGEPGKIGSNAGEIWVGVHKVYCQ